MVTQRRPDLQESTAQQNSAVCILGGNKIAPKFDTLVATYTGCKRRNGIDFGRVFLMLNYTEKPQNTYIQSSMVTEI